MSLVQPRPISAPDLQLWLQGDAASPQVVDVREAQELAMAKFPSDVLHLPLRASSAWIETLQLRLTPDQPVVVLCHAGVRSHHFGLWLLDQAWGLEVWNLEGGIDAWSTQVDDTVPRY
jgi:rhodanese-related sulfurtransferase